MTPTDRARARRRLRNAAVALTLKGAKHAGTVARIEAVLSLEGWPFDRVLFDNFCRELGI